MRSTLLFVIPFLVSCSVGPPPPAAVPKTPPGTTTADGGGPSLVIQTNKLVRLDGKELTPEFAAIDSFDVNLERREVVLSAKRDKSFDIGLVSLDGSDIRWIPEDPADEVAVKWAPRGHKVSYIIRGTGGDLVRTVHVPTAMQLVADFPYATVKSLAWDESGERYSVTLTGPEASEHVESLKYDGTARKTARAPATKLDVNVEPYSGGVMMRPTLRYGEKLPLVLWQTDKPLEWNETRGALMRDHRIAIAVVREIPTVVPDEPWIDRDRVYTVSKGDVESAAARRIAQQLKEPNGRR